MSELKPCPFCGKKPEIRRWLSSPTVASYTVECFDRQCNVQPRTDHRTKRPAAIRLWNTRKDASHE